MAPVLSKPGQGQGHQGTGSSWALGGPTVTINQQLGAGTVSSLSCRAPWVAGRGQRD